MITFTGKAAAKVRDLLAAQAQTGLALRVGVRPGGCAGHEYSMAFASAPEAGDTVVDQDGFRVVVDAESSRFLAGARVDYVEGLQGAGFKFDNPNASSGCGCGSSFSAQQEAGEPDPALAMRVEAALETIRPMLRGDGGDVELVEVRGSTAMVRLAGACAGCSSSYETLRYVIERRVREAVPEVQRILAV